MRAAMMLVALGMMCTLGCLLPELEREQPPDAGAASGAGGTDAPGGAGGTDAPGDAGGDADAAGGN
jgi:hypothetical protein